VPDVRMLHEFRTRLGVAGLRRINEALLQPLLQPALSQSGTVALIDATDLPAACAGFKKNIPVSIRLGTPPWAHARSKPVRAAGLWATRNTPCVCG
jgi:hypothetical protein